MRLSMIDHEEHQRKEADKKKKEAETEAQSEGEASLDAPSPPGPGPTTSQARSSGLTSLSSVATPLSCSPSFPRDSSSSQRTSFLSSLSRSRTPPSPGNRISVHLNDDTTTWHRRTPSPTPYSTLSNVISSASTPSKYHALVDVNGDVAKGEAIAGSSIPSILIGTSNSTPLQRSNDTSDQSQGSPKQDHVTRVLTDASSFQSSSYDHLPSSPESSFAREPLLDSDGVSDGHAAH